MAASVVVNQPVAAPQWKTWSSGLCDCCSDMSSCCYGFWCLPCFACSTTAGFGQCTCLPLLDFLSPSALGFLGIPLCAPPAGLSMRVAVRYRYNIEGSLLDDILLSCCCACCSWCQVAREIKHHKLGPVVTNAMTINFQPAAVAPPPQINVSNVMMGSPQSSYPMQGQGPQMQGQGPQMQGQGYQMQGQGYTMQEQGYQMQGQGYKMQEQGPQMQGGQDPQMQGQGYKMQEQGYQMQGQGYKMQEQGPQMQGGQDPQMQGQGYKMQGHDPSSLHSTALYPVNESYKNSMV